VIQYPPSLIAVGGARTGIAPVNLLDVQDVNGNVYYWSDRPIVAPAVLPGAGAMVPAAVSAAMAAVAAPPPGQSIVWSLPTRVSSSGSGSYRNVVGENYQVIAGGSLTGAYLELTGSSSLSPSKAWVQWSGFQVPPLPGGAVVEAIVPVVMVSGLGQCAAHTLYCGEGSTSGSPNLVFEGSFPGTPTPYSGLYMGGLGGSAADLANAYMGYQIWQTLNDAPYGDNATVTFVGMAIYYSLGASGDAGGSGGFEGRTGAPISANPAVPGYAPWLLSVPSFSFHRSLQTDMGSFILQNLSGDTLSRDFERILRRSALEGALFVWRLWQPDAQASWVEVHGTLSVEAVGVDTVQLRGAQLLNPSQDDTPLENYCETCQLQWGGPRCGSTQDTECSYSYQTCQVVERIMVVMNDYEKNYGQTLANTAQQVVNRARKI
jgi:hypothetical protein